MRVRVDRAVCVGHGRCYTLAPEVFCPDEEGRCVVVREDVPHALAEKVRRAVSNCPEEALSLDED